MEINVLYRLYNIFGGHKSFSLAGTYLEDGMPKFGDAIREIEITIHFHQGSPAKKSLEKLHDEFHQNLSTLPKCVFFRKKQRLVLDFEAKFTTGFEIKRNSRPPIQINPEWVKNTLSEIIHQLPLIKSKIKKSDDFNFDSFESYLKQKLYDIPIEVSELEKIEQRVSARKKQEFNKLDDWEKLNINWDDYHPNARNAVNQPFLWSEVDEFSPNGNDTGADTLELFKEWNKRHKDVSALVFLENLLAGWEVDLDSPYKSDYTSRTYFQCVVGLAFASAKLRGKCEDKLKEIAIKAIDKYLNEIQAEIDWQFFEECQQKQLICRAIIENMPNKAS